MLYNEIVLTWCARIWKHNIVVNFIGWHFLNIIEPLVLLLFHSLVVHNNKNIIIKETNEGKWTKMALGYKCHSFVDCQRRNNPSWRRERLFFSAPSSRSCIRLTVSQRPPVDRRRNSSSVLWFSLQIKPIINQLVTTDVITGHWMAQSLSYMWNYLLQYYMLFF